MFDKVKEFEKQIAEFYGAPFAVATDCCTHAIELCIRYTGAKSVTCPVQTYISVPFTLDKLNIKWSWEEKNWTDFYYIGNTTIIDAAVYWKENSYIDNTFMCLSFQFKKHLSLGRGGMILCNNEEDYLELKKLSYDGRLPNIPWADQNINSIGYHYYMTPETAEMGLKKFQDAVNTESRDWSWKDYPDLRCMDIFK